MAKSKSDILRHHNWAAKIDADRCQLSQSPPIPNSTTSGLLSHIACCYGQAIIDHELFHSERKFAAIEAACQKMHKDSVVFRDSVSSELPMLPLRVMTCMANTTFKVSCLLVPVSPDLLQLFSLLWGPSTISLANIRKQKPPCKISQPTKR